jgi:hypothetical protein
MNEHRMIEIAQNYFKEPNNEINAVRLQEIQYRNSGVNPATPTIGLPAGEARKHGLLFFLASKNVYPVYGDHVAEIRLSMYYFDSQLARVNNESLGWRFQRETALRYYWLVHDFIVNGDIVSHVILGKDRRMEETTKKTKVWAAALLIFRVTYGWYRTPTSNGGMLALDQMALYPENQLVHNYMVLPLIHTLCMELDPHCDLCPREILLMDLRNLERNIKQKSKYHGNWSQAEALRRIYLPVDDPRRITDADRFMVSGIEYKFARLFSLIITDFKRPWNKRLSGRAREDNKCWLTNWEKHTFYKSLDDTYVTARYGEPHYQP